MPKTAYSQSFIHSPLLPPPTVTTANYVNLTFTCTHFWFLLGSCWNEDPKSLDVFVLFSHLISMVLYDLVPLCSVYQAFSVYQTFCSTCTGFTVL